MALRVWLPLNGDLHNQGLDGGVTVTNNGATVSDAGKIGKCYSFTTSQYMELNNLPFSSLTHCSISFWIKVTGKGNSGWLPFTGQSTSYYLLATSAGTGAFYNSTNNVGTNGKFYIDGVKGTTPAAMNEWHHYVVTDVNLSTWTKFYINKYSTAWNFAGSVNDVRIYDHVLSQKEIKEISKGLVVHYKLDANPNAGIGNTNLIANGWGGTENWPQTGASYVSTVVPSEISGSCTNSYGAMTSKEYIPLIPDHSYTMSGYVKRGTSTQNYCYLTLVVYDIDKNQITCPQNASGFLARSYTTLSQDLHSGDTVIHLTDASGWTSPPSSYNYVAIFGYKDSTGYTYPDFTYTRRVYQYGTNSDRTHIDIPNNQVTINSAYSGETIPAGTAVCISGNGGYYYPKSINTTNIDADTWTLLTNTFTPKNVARLTGAKYVRVMASLYAGQWAAGLTLKDNTATAAIEDVSGYHNNLTIDGTFNIATGISRYNNSLLFNGVNNILKGTLSLCNDYKYTASFWVKPKTISGATQWIFSCGSGSNHQFGCYINSSAIITQVGGVVGSSVTSWSQTITANTPYHIAIVSDGTNVSVYVNGISLGLNPKNGTTTGSTFWIGQRSGAPGSYNLNGNLSDFRIYATALSADDILELYNTAAVIDDGGDLMCYETNEGYSNILFTQNYGIESKTWATGLSRHEQTNCKCTLTDDGYRIYRTPNVNNQTNGGSNSMWGGFVIDNTNNRYNLTKSHTYLLEFDIKGQSTNAASDVNWNNRVGNPGGGLNAAPTNVVISNPVTTNYNNQNSWDHFSYKFTINDDVYKVCTTSYSTFVAGETYLSYQGFKYGFGYTNTGELGTDLYIKNIRLIDITTSQGIDVRQTGIFNTGGIIESDGEVTFYSTNTSKTSQLIEF